MRFDILTLFPELVLPYTKGSILGRAQEAGLIEIHTHNIRDYSTDKHNKVDDKPYGGGAGMLMTCQPLFDCIRAVKKLNSGPVIYMSPQGTRFKQEKAEQLAQEYQNSQSPDSSSSAPAPGLILLCGRYEGIDNRVREALVDQEISIGDYVLTGGELASLVIVDAVARLIPGVLGKHASAEEDSFSESLDRKKEYPHYTKPEIFEGLSIPDVLKSGNHGAIKKWRMDKLKPCDQ
jgi:tRNA (guanine37-N1)-methyltransferase